MICNKCGADNDDLGRFCQTCGHKLQSGGGGRAGDQDEDPGTIAALGQAGDASGQTPRLGRYLEAWVLAACLVAAGFVLIRMDMSWLLYVLIPLAALAAWLRGI